MQNNFLSVLRHKDFQKIWLSQVFSQIALNMLTFALVLHIFDLTGKATSISLVMIATAIPVAIIGPFSGILADKVDFRKILVCTNYARLFAVILLLFATKNVLAILEIIFLISAISQIFTPAESAALPLVVPKDELVAANSTVMTTTYITLLFGYAVAGPLLNVMTPSWLFVICGFLYFAAAEVTRKLSHFDKKKTHRLTVENFAHGVEKAWDEVKFSFSYLTKTKSIFEPMLKLTIGWTVLGAFITLLPSYGESVLHISTKFVGLVIIAPAGFGMVISAWLMNKRKNFIHESNITKGFLIVSISLFLFSLYFYYKNFIFSWEILILLVIALGFGSSMVQISAQTLLHINSDADKRGRVFGISSMQLRLATCLPALLIGALSDLTSPLATMILLAVVCMIYSSTILFRRSDH